MECSLSVELPSIMEKEGELGRHTRGQALATVVVCHILLSIKQGTTEEASDNEVMWLIKSCWGKPHHKQLQVELRG